MAEEPFLFHYELFLFPGSFGAGSTPSAFPSTGFGGGAFGATPSTSAAPLAFGAGTSTPPAATSATVDYLPPTTLDKTHICPGRLYTLTLYTLTHTFPIAYTQLRTNSLVINRFRLCC